MAFKVDEDPMKQADAVNRNKPDVVRAAFIVGAALIMTVTALIGGVELNYGDTIKQVKRSYELVSWNQVRLRPLRPTASWTIDKVGATATVEIPTQVLNEDGWTLDKVEAQIAKSSSGQTLYQYDTLTEWFPATYSRVVNAQTVFTINFADMPGGVIKDRSFYALYLLYYYTHTDGTKRQFADHQTGYFKYLK